MLLDKKVGFLFNDFHENSGDIPTEDMKFSSLNIHKQGQTSKYVSKPKTTHNNQIATPLETNTTHRLTKTYPNH